MTSVSDTDAAAAGTPNYGYPDSTSEDGALTTSHSVTVSGLLSGTTYHFRPVSHGSPETLGSEISATTQNGSSGGSHHHGSGGGSSKPTTPGLVLGASTGLSDAQIEAILVLLRSFGAGQSVIDKVNLSLHGEAPGATSAPAGGSVLGAITYLFTQTLTTGSYGPEVSELQKRLTQEGLYSGPITMSFGPLTKAAVIAYQKKYGILAVGIVGPLTRAKLNGK
jgi:hypothetical protein